MTYSTISLIHSLLSIEVDKTKFEFDSAKCDLNNFEDAHSLSWCRDDLAKVPEEIRSEYNTLLVDYNQAREAYTAAQSAFLEFTSHSWS